MQYDVVIIGGGLAGLVCGIRLAEAGKSCAIVTRGQSSLTFASGSFDLLSRLPDGRAVSSLAQAWPELARQAPRHPYVLLGEAAIAPLCEAAQQLLARSGLTFQGDYQQNHQRLTPAGRWRAAWLTLDGIPTRTPGTPTPWRRPLVIGIEGFLDFQPELVVAELNRQGMAARSATLTLPALAQLRRNPSEFRSLNVARVLDQPEQRAALLAEIRALAADADAVLFPACIGRTEPVSAAWTTLLDKPFLLLPTLPPSLPGTLIESRLRRRFSELGGQWMQGDQVQSVTETAQDRYPLRIQTSNHGDIPLRARQLVLATGSYLSRGLEMEQHRLREATLGLDVTPLDGTRDDWSAAEMFRPQRWMQTGVRIDAALRPFRQGETQSRIRAIGGVLEGFDSLQQGCGGGVTLLTALQAAQHILADREA